METPFVYLDNASTSFPKPDVLWQSTKHYLEQICASPSRSGSQRTRKAEEYIQHTRSMLGNLFHVQNVNKISFTLNSTQALNMIIKGFLKPGDHVITTNIEHTSVLRPLEKLKQKSIISYNIVESDDKGLFRIEDFESAILSNTKLIIINHASNVTGVLAPIKEIGRLAHSYGIKFLVDASQTAGFTEVDVEENYIDFLAFTGHKSMLGPSGTGGAYISDASLIDTLLEGGTGTNSHSLFQPESIPAKFEAGTLNYLGIVSLGGALDFLFEKNIARIREQELSLTQACLDALSALKEVRVYGTKELNQKVPVISFTIDGLYSGEIAHILDEQYHIMVRPGLQCAPLIHKTLGTFPHGTVRISIGHTTTEKDLEYFVESLQHIIKKYT